MRSFSFHESRLPGLRRAQRGASLIVALVSLVAMIAAAFALFRSVDSANMASANYQFQRSAEQNTDRQRQKKMRAENTDCGRDEGLRHCGHGRSPERLI